MLPGFGLKNHVKADRCKGLLMARPIRRQGIQDGRLSGSSGNIFLEGGDVVPEGLEAGFGEAAGGAGHLALESFLDRYIPGGREFVDLDTEVAGSRSCLFLDVGEVG